MVSYWRRLALLAFSVIPVAASAEPIAGPQTTAEYQSLRLLASPDPYEKWRAVLARLDSDRIRVERCLVGAGCRDIVAKPMADLVRRLSGFAGGELLAEVNRHYNHFPYVPDGAGGGAADDWASPLVFLQRSGDCEDYALAKYLTLRLVGVPETAMDILILRERASGRDHAVLLVRDSGRSLVLDNLRELSMLDAYETYRPLLVLTAESGWHPASRRAPTPIPFRRM